MISTPDVFETQRDNNAQIVVRFEIKESSMYVFSSIQIVKHCHSDSRLCRAISVKSDSRNIIALKVEERCCL